VGELDHEWVALVFFFFLSEGDRRTTKAVETRKSGWDSTTVRIWNFGGNSSRRGYRERGSRRSKFEREEIKKEEERSREKSQVEIKTKKKKVRSVQPLIRSSNLSEVIGH
jgi:hypothetical protein